MFSWLKIVELLLTFANMAFSSAERQGAIKEGEDRVILQNLLELQRRTATYKAIEKKVDSMTPEAVQAELEKNGDYRD